jgi:hypothetical protein
MNRTVAYRVSKISICIGILMLATTPSHAQSLCLDNLLASITEATDVSSCNPLTLTNGQILAVKTEDGLFFQTRDGINATFYLIDLKGKWIEAIHLKRSNIFPPMDRALPDAKEHYFPFYSLQRNGTAKHHPKSIRFVCQKPETFLATSIEACPK